MMKLVETKISETAIYMRYADNPDTTRATQWIDFQIPLDGLKVPGRGGERVLGNIEDQYFGSIHLAALRQVRETITAETQRISGQ
jgi:hypothetical protein